MSVRRENIEEQSVRLRNYVSESVLEASGVALPMTQTLDQMVRTAAKAGVTLHISTQSQAQSLDVIRDQLTLLESEFAAQIKSLRWALTEARDAILHDSRVRKMTDGSGEISPYFPGRKALLNRLGEVLNGSQGVQKELRS